MVRIDEETKKLILRAIRFYHTTTPDGYELSINKLPIDYLEIICASVIRNEDSDNWNFTKLPYPDQPFSFNWKEDFLVRRQYQLFQEITGEELSTVKPLVQKMVDQLCDELEQD